MIESMFKYLVCFDSRWASFSFFFFLFALAKHLSLFSSRLFCTMQVWREKWRWFLLWCLCVSVQVCFIDLFWHKGSQGIDSSLSPTVSHKRRFYSHDNNSLFFWLELSNVSFGFANILLYVYILYIESFSPIVHCWLSGELKERK